MANSNSFDQIDSAGIDTLLKQYPNVVPTKLARLDNQRYTIIPTAVAKRKEDVSLSKTEVATLVEWKLSHGKWRPALQGLVQQNADSAVHDLTRDAFESFSSGSKSADEAKQAVNTLAKLKGIGPATASLLLSVFDPDTGPFFSDELFRWCFLEDGRGKGWDREIKYNVKEYVELYSRVQGFRERFKKSYGRAASAVELEKVAYVLGKTATNAGPPASGTKRKAGAEKDDLSNKAAVVAGGKQSAEKDDLSNKAAVVAGGKQSAGAKVRKATADGTKPNAVRKVRSKAATSEGATAAANRPKRTKK